MYRFSKLVSDPFDLSFIPHAPHERQPLRRQLLALCGVELLDASSTDEIEEESDGERNSCSSDEQKNRFETVESQIMAVGT